ncbi:MAG: NAD(+) diphosphatase [Clostridia bacterium]|nr:NAD(+) diphosphatase [Clostridia bacterium]
MIQDIAPKQMDITYRKSPIDRDSKVIVVDDMQFVIDENEENDLYPSLSDVETIIGSDADEFMYLFAIDETPYYLYLGTKSHLLTEGFDRRDRRTLFDMADNVIGHIAYTAGHLYDWYQSNRYCGKCGQPMAMKDHERVMACPSCGLMKYPQISPVVIVAVENGDKMLFTKYADRNYDRYALIAGFVEIGETLEDAVRREVFEEVGIRVKNIRYYDSQPWGITGGLLTGFFAELDGDETITLDTSELKEGSWLTRAEMPEVHPYEKSLTRTMMYAWYKK